MKAQVVKIENSDHVVMLLDELGDEISQRNAQESSMERLPDGFYHNRSAIIQAFAEGTLYGALQEHTMSEVETLKQDLSFMRFRNSWPFSNCSYWPGKFYLPCFSIVNADRQCEFIWVAERVQRRGLGSLLVRACQVQEALCVLKPSTEFWVKQGFRMDNVDFGHHYVLALDDSDADEDRKKKRRLVAE